MLKLFLVMLFGCGVLPGRHAGSVCPETPYSPKGREVESGCECADGIAFLCASETCDVERTSLTCERRGDLEDFLAGPCAGCYVRARAGSVFEAECGE